MISIIICSVDDARFAAVSANLAGLLKDEPREIVRIPDARSICEGYTRGIARSRGEHLVFCHDDIEILNPDFAARLKQHLSQFDLVGVAGTSRLIRGEWVAAGPPYIFGQVAQKHPQEGFIVRIFARLPAPSAGFRRWMASSSPLAEPSSRRFRLMPKRLMDSTITIWISHSPPTWQDSGWGSPMTFTSFTDRGDCKIKAGKNTHGDLSRNTPDG